MAFHSHLISAITYSLGSIGVVANLLLIIAIALRTPAHMRAYSVIIAASAYCDLVGVIAMMLSVTREQVFSTAAVLEFHGICLKISVEFCCALFGVQVCMYTATCFLLSMSFAYRLRLLEQEFTHHRESRMVITIILLIMLINFPLIPLYLHATTRKEHIINVHRNDDSIGVMQILDSFTIGTCTYSILSSILTFTASVKMRKKMIAKLEQKKEAMSTVTKTQHGMLVKALNLQLFVSAFFLLGIGLFGFNLIAINLLPGFPETTDFAVPLCNLQNVLAALCNLYVITPYRRWLLCSGKIRSITGNTSTGAIA